MSQCCGDAGVGAFFVALDRDAPRPAYRSMVDRTVAALRTRATAHEPSGGLYWAQAENRSQPGWVVPQTGFMQGAAGVGTFLVHADPSRRGRGPAVRWPDSPFA